MSLLLIVSMTDILVLGNYLFLSLFRPSINPAFAESTDFDHLVLGPLIVLRLDLVTGPDEKTDYQHGCKRKFDNEHNCLLVFLRHLQPPAFLNYLFCTFSNIIHPNTAIVKHRRGRFNLILHHSTLLKGSAS